LRWGGCGSSAIEKGKKSIRKALKKGNPSTQHHQRAAEIRLQTKKSHTEVPRLLKGEFIWEGGVILPKSEAFISRLSNR